MTNSSERVIIPTIFKHIPQLVAGVSTRHGGKSTAAYQTLNLGLHTDDHPDMVQQNLSLFCRDLGISPQALARSYQIHGDVIWETKEPGYTSGYDAIIAHAPGIFAGVGIADCCPILLADPVRQTSAAIHAGRRRFKRAPLQRPQVDSLFRAQFQPTHRVQQPQAIRAIVSFAYPRHAFQHHADQPPTQDAAVLLAKSRACDLPQARGALQPHAR